MARFFFEETIFGVLNMLRKPRSEDEPIGDLSEEFQSSSGPTDDPPTDKSGSEPISRDTIRRPPVKSLDKFLNIMIGALSLIVVALIISLIIRLNSSPQDPAKFDDKHEVISNGSSTVNNDETSQIKSQTLRVEVLNGTEIPRLASKAADFLRTKGFDVVQTGNAKHANFRKSIVQDRIGNMPGAVQVARTLGIGESNVLQQKNPQLYLDVTVIIGQDYKSLKFQNP
jgi:hypothetical protein